MMEYEQIFAEVVSNVQSLVVSNGNVDVIVEQLSQASDVLYRRFHIESGSLNVHRASEDWQVRMTKVLAQDRDQSASERAAGEYGWASVCPSRPYVLKASYAGFSRGSATSSLGHSDYAGVGGSKLNLDQFTHLVGGARVDEANVFDEGHQSKSRFFSNLNRPATAQELCDFLNQQWLNAPSVDQVASDSSLNLNPVDAPSECILVY